MSIYINGNASLTVDQILDIRLRCRERGDQARLAREYNVSQSVISRIVRCKSYKPFDITMPKHGKRWL